MLKLTNSFYRYLWLTCETIHSRVHEKTYTHLSCRRKVHPVSPTSNSPLSPALHTEQPLRFFSNIKKRLHIKKKVQKTNDPKKLRQMSEPVKPTTVNHVSCGGQFEISTSGDNRPSTDQWKKQPKGEPSRERGGGSSQIPPDFRVWELVGRRSDKLDGSSFKFKVLSYNVLAQYLLECHPYLYTDCSPYDLKWKIRGARLFEEITQLAPDILCLQEVQATHLESFYEKFEEIGYCGVYKQKTGHRHDGCAIYYKQDLFHLMDQVSVEFYQPELPILNRDNIGVMVKLMPIGSPFLTPLVVATTHLLYNPKRTDVRLAQMQVLLAEIDRFAYFNNGRECGHLPIILTGDLNSTPDSAVIKLLDKGHVSAEPFRDSSDWERIGVTDNCQHLAVYLSRQQGDIANHHTEIKIYNTESSPSASREAPLGTDGGDSTDCDGRHSAMFNSGVLGHSLKLTSVYDRVKSNGHCEASTFQDFWVTVDYIYFSRYSALSLLERLRLPTAEECEALGRLPNELYASDHLALGAIFELRPRKCSL